jgi:hypothetical protein
MRIAIKILRSRVGLDRPILVCHIDLAIDDYKAFCLALWRDNSWSRAACAYILVYLLRYRGFLALRADRQAGAQCARQRDAGRDEHCNPKAPHKALIQDFLEHPSLPALDLWGYLRLGKLRRFRIQSAPNFQGLIPR